MLPKVRKKPSVSLPSGLWMTTPVCLVARSGTGLLRAPSRARLPVGRLVVLVVVLKDYVLVQKSNVRKPKKHENLETKNALIS